jgi:uncharacterized protein (DUF2235 family)
MPKRLVIYCDGTWNRPDETSHGQPCPTNVWKLYVATAKRDAVGIEQCAYYHKGVGTGRFDHWRGGAFGVGLSSNVRHAYRFVAENFDEGDELFLLGFSRGAYTARSLAGLIRNSGILRRDELHRVDEAYALYRHRGKPPASEEAREFRAKFAVEAETPIRFIGVWDTVGALGIPLSGIGLISVVNRRWQFHDVTLSRTVRSAFQALAIDERRRPFKPTLWEQQADAVDQELEQVWFRGVHCDVGGGYPDATLADIPLLWLAERAQSCGLAYTSGVFPRTEPDGTAHSYTEVIPVFPDPMGPQHDSRKLFYKLAPAYDRPIGGADHGHESVASSVVARRAKGGYDPPELRTYLDGAPDVCDVDAAIARVIDG